MSVTDWQQVVDDDCRVPRDRGLTEMTAELTAMLGSTDPHERDGLGYTVLATWVDEGVYDDLLPGLGDGMLVGMRVGLGERGTDTVFRRSFSALVLAECLVRSQTVSLPQQTVLRWGDAALAWLVGERDLRGYVEGRGWAHAIAHGADLLRALAGSAYLGTPELVAVLDVIADRIETLDRPLVHGELDRLALATIEILQRDLVPMSVWGPWVVRLRSMADRRVAPEAEAPGSPGPVLLGEADPFRRTVNAEGYLRSLHLLLGLTTAPPPGQEDLVISLREALRVTNAAYLEATGE